MERETKYLKAKKLSWIYPGLGHIEIDKKNKGITLLTIETLSLAMAIVSKNSLDKTYDKYQDSKQIYDLEAVQGQNRRQFHFFVVRRQQHYVLSFLANQPI